MFILILMNVFFFCKWFFEFLFLCLILWFLVGLWWDFFLVMVWMFLCVWWECVVLGLWKEFVFFECIGGWVRGFFCRWEGIGVRSFFRGIWVLLWCFCVFCVGYKVGEVWSVVNVERCVDYGWDLCCGVVESVFFVIFVIEIFDDFVGDDV